MNEARSQEYLEITARAGEALNTPPVYRLQVLRLLRAQMRRVERRDFFRPPEREQARRALRDLAQHDSAQHDSAQHATSADQEVPT